MPELDGNETSKRIREYIYQNGIEQPIISSLTGHTEQCYVDRAIDSGIN
jgi:hypothetical protein